MISARATTFLGLIARASAKVTVALDCTTVVVRSDGWSFKHWKGMATSKVLGSCSPSGM